jgi:phospholipase/carboxylesterase
MDNQSTSIVVDDWVLRIRIPAGSGPFPVILMLHGWTGDENAMWIFASRLPKEALLLSPRGLYPTPMGGFGWHPHQANGWPGVNDFKPSVDALISLLTPEHFPSADFMQMHLVGFSQGAALAYIFTLFYPERVTSVAGMSGFLPDGSSSMVGEARLKGLPVFMAHGTQDELVPVERARQSAKLLEQAGGRVIYCEDEVGHKLSANCFRSLEAFYKEELRVCR